MSNQLAAGYNLELLDRLKQTVEDVAARADKLGEDYRSRTTKERRRCELAVEELQRQLATATVNAEAQAEADKAAAVDKFDKRRTRIGRAYQSSKEQGLKGIEENIGARKYELQKRMLQAEKDRDAALSAAAGAYEQFRTDLATEEQALSQSEGRAQTAFKGYGRLVSQFHKAYEQPPDAMTDDEHKLLSELRDLLAKAHADLARFQGLFLYRFFKYRLVWIVLALGALPLVPVLQNFGIKSYNYALGGAVAGGVIVLAVVFHFLAQGSATTLAASLARTLARARRVHDAAAEKGQLHQGQEMQRIKTEFVETTRSADQRLKTTLAEAAEQRVACRRTSDERTVGANQTNERQQRTRVERLEREAHGALQRLRQTTAVRIKALNDACEQALAKVTADYDAARRTLEAEWHSRLEPICQSLNSARDTAAKLFPPWDAPGWKDWKPPAAFSQAAQFGRLHVDVARLCATMPKEKSLVLPGPSQFTVPLCLGFPQQGSILFETGATGHDRAIGTLNNIILRLLSTAPAGRLNFTILDPVGLGQNFAGVMHLADYEEQLINSRIWTQSTQIEQKLADLNEHMEKVIQMYLRNEYQTIAEYNEQAGVIAEKYHFLVVADFPANFTDTAAKRLLSIAASGARCGVYMLILWDKRIPLPQDFIPDELRKSCIGLESQGEKFILTGRSQPGADLLLDEPPGAEAATEFIHLAGRFSRDSSRVEVPFEHVAPKENEIWSEETTHELTVPIGRTGATKLQYLAVGKGTCQHGLIAGKTGSGKSTLFHVIITNLALWCSPEQVEFYLVDFKKGVEFKCYASRRLPHARVVAIESDREFGLSVLQRVDDELKRRGDRFRQLGVQDIAGYKKAGGTEAIPRTLLMVDEFQEFFVEDDKISQTASLLMDRIVRQGRAFGIHVLLGSQTLGGAYTVARTTLGQMVIRIALQCNEADAYLIMDDTNPAPRLLSRPGEGIYNDMAGALEGNSPFQVVWLPDETRDRSLGKVRERADRNGEAYPGPIVFEGNAPAEVRENVLLRKLLTADAPPQRPSAGRIWLGAPNSIKGPTEAAFHRQSGNHLLLVGQRDEAILAILSIGLVSLAAQYPVGGARFIFCDAMPPATPPRQYLEELLAVIPHAVTLAKPGDLPEIMKELQAEKTRRAEAVDAESEPPVFLFIHGLPRFSRLRYEEEFGFSSSEGEPEVKPAAVFNDLICEGARVGFHIIATCDSYNNVNRFMSRKALSEFELRVLFQMSANDSASLIDNPKAGSLGLHRAILYNAQEGYLETFRPYAVPDSQWIEEVGRELARLLAKPVVSNQ